MSIANSVLYNDILELFRGRQNMSSNCFKYTVELITQNIVVVARQVHEVVITRDFASNFTDYITLLVTTTMADYDNVIYAGRENLKVRLTREMVDPKTGRGVGSPPKTSVFRGKLTKPTNHGMLHSDAYGTNPEAKNMELHDFTIQLLNDSLMSQRSSGISGTIRGTSVDSVLSILMSNAGNIPVKVYPTDRPNPINQLIIPEGLKLSDIPFWFQLKGGGVYNYNIGAYFMQDRWFVYPLLKTEPDVNRKHVTICNISEGTMPSVDVTSTFSENTLYILATGAVKFKDASESKEFNQGNAVRFSLPNSMKSMVTHNNGKTELNGSGFIEGGNNKQLLNNVITGNRITSNTCYEISRIANNQGAMAEIEWQNADVSFIEPNMSVTILYMEGTTVRSMRGVILGIDYGSEVLDGVTANKQHTGNATLHLFLERHNTI